MVNIINNQNFILGSMFILSKIMYNNYTKRYPLHIIHNNQIYNNKLYIPICMHMHDETYFSGLTEDDRDGD